MKLQLLKAKYILLAFFIGLSACTKEGDPGPTGPKGDPGPQGEKGETGTANVIYSDWFALERATDKGTVPMHSGATKGIYYIFTTPHITQDIIDKGNLYLYFAPTNGSAVPFPIDDYAGISMMVFSMSLNQFQIVHYIRGNTNPGDGFIVNDAKVFRYVIVPGGTTANERSKQVDYSDYEAVKAHYNIPD